MVVYIIDAFNLFHKIPTLKNSPNPHQDLIFYIKKYRLTGSKNNRVIVIFDGFPKESLQNYGFEILFSCKLTADYAIENLLKKFPNKSQVSVVSDDNYIRSFTKREGAKPVRLLEFLQVRDKHAAASSHDDKEISYPLQKEITDELRKIWLKE